MYRLIPPPGANPSTPKWYMDLPAVDTFLSKYSARIPKILAISDAPREARQILLRHYITVVEPK